MKVMFEPEVVSEKVPVAVQESKKVKPDAEELDKVRLKKLLPLQVRVWALELEKIKVEALAVRVSMISRATPAPERSIVLFDASKVPALISNTFVTMISPSAVKVVPVWSKVKLL